MQTRVSQKKNYVAVEIPKEAEIPPKRRIWMKFRRKQEVEVAKGNVNLKKSDLKRLFSLAKPEKYYLMGPLIAFLF